MQYRGFTLDRFQVDAIEALQRGESVLVAAPTGTGKTVVADWMVEKTLADGHEVVFTAPIKALSNQKYRDYCKLLGEENVGLVTGDLVIRRDAPCRVMTTEILRNMLLSGDELNQLRAVIIDEIHFLDDPERGTVWEEVLIYLHQRVQVVGLSATLSNLHEFASWLSFVRDRAVEVVEEHKRAVPLSFAVACRESQLRSPAEMDTFSKEWQSRNAYALRRAEERGGRGRHGRRGGRRANKVGSQTRHGDVFDLLWPDYAPYLYFTFSRRDAENMARNLVRSMKAPLISPEQYEQVKDRLGAFRAEGNDDILDDQLAKMLRGGVAFHHAGLHVALKALVEELYERKLVQVLYCTGTFALGINMPARTAVFDGLMRFNGQEMINLPAREFMQMAGRAGRRGLDESGLVVVRCDIEEWPDIRRQLSDYLKGRLEPVRSRFSLSFNSVVNLLERHSLDRIRTLVERSYLAWHRSQQAEKDAEHLDKLRDRLIEGGWSPGAPPPKSLKREVKRMKRIEKRAHEGSERSWNEFQARVSFLQRWGYLDEDNSFNAGAKVVRHLQISEIFVSEVFLSGLFDELEPGDLFGVLCGMCANLPRGATVPAARRYKRLGRHIEKIRMSAMVLEAEELTGQSVTWDAALIPFGRWWVEGKSLTDILAQLHHHTDVSGDLVGAFRRAKDLAGQLRGAWADLPDKRSMVDSLMRRVTRDEVEVVG